MGILVKKRMDLITLAIVAVAGYFVLKSGLLKGGASSTPAPTPVPEGGGEEDTERPSSDDRDSIRDAAVKEAGGYNEYGQGGRSRSVQSNSKNIGGTNISVSGNGACACANGKCIGDCEGMKSSNLALRRAYRTSWGWY